MRDGKYILLQLRRFLPHPHSHEKRNVVGISRRFLPNLPLTPPVSRQSRSFRSKSASSTVIFTTYHITPLMSTRTTTKATRPCTMASNTAVWLTDTKSKPFQVKYGPLRKARFSFEIAPLPSTPSTAACSPSTSGRKSFESAAVIPLEYSTAASALFQDTFLNC